MHKTLTHTHTHACFSQFHFLFLPHTAHTCFSLSFSLCNSSCFPVTRSEHTNTHAKKYIIAHAQVHRCRRSFIFFYFFSLLHFSYHYRHASTHSVSFALILSHLLCSLSHSLAHSLNHSFRMHASSCMHMHTTHCVLCRFSHALHVLYSLTHKR